MFESTKIIGHRQYRKATELFQLAERRVSGPIAFIYQNINMTKRLVTLEDGTEVKTCSAALGHSFAAGTTDGEGDSHVSLSGYCLSHYRLIIALIVTMIFV